MRILVVSPYPIEPPEHGGRVRVAGLAGGLAAAGAEVTVLSPWHPRQRHKALPPGVEHRTHLLGAGLLPERLAPSQVLLSLQPPPGRLLERLGRFDAYQFEFCAHAGWLDSLPPGAKVVYSAHNVERDFFEHEPQRYLVRRASARRLERLERLMVERSEMVITCSDGDARRLERLYGPTRTTVVPNAGQLATAARPAPGLRERARARLGLAPGDRAILFLGGRAFHNREAAAFLARDVLPRLGSNARLLVAGRCARSVRGVRDSRLRALGYVRDLAALLAAADVGVNPVAASSGSSVKVADYLAAGLPVVTTEAGARGLGRLSRLVQVSERDQLAEVLGNGLPAPVRRDSAELGLTWEPGGERLLARLGGV